MAGELVCVIYGQPLIKDRAVKKSRKKDLALFRALAKVILHSCEKEGGARMSS